MVRRRNPRAGATGPVRLAFLSVFSTAPGSLSSTLRPAPLMAGPGERSRAVRAAVEDQRQGPSIRNSTTYMFRRCIAQALHRRRCRHSETVVQRVSDCLQDPIPAESRTSATTRRSTPSRKSSDSSHRQQTSCRSRSSSSTRCSSTSKMTTESITGTGPRRRLLGPFQQPGPLRRHRAERAHGDPTLQKLIDRFAVPVALSDTDVETVVGKWSFARNPTRSPRSKAALDAVRGEIDQPPRRHALEAKGADKPRSFPTTRCCPLGGDSGNAHFGHRQGRKGRSAAHTAEDRARGRASVATKPLGTVIGGDFILRRSPPACSRAASS